MKVEVFSPCPVTGARMPSAAGWFHWIQAFWRRAVQLSRRQPRRLRLCDSLPLGDRRFVAVVEFENARFLLGGTSGSLVLLARLKDGPAATQPRAGSEQASSEQEER